MSDTGHLFYETGPWSLKCEYCGISSIDPRAEQKCPKRGNTAQVGDVVQIDPDHDTAFGGCLLTVTEVKSWGVQGFVRVPGRPNAGNAYYRVPFGKIARIGWAEYVPIEVTDDNSSTPSERVAGDET
jgi:hypothetical protein